MSAVDAISDMVTPVVLIAVGGVTAGVLLREYNQTAAHITRLSRERLGIMAGPQGEVLTNDQLRPIDRERLTQISVQTQPLVQRFKHMRDAAILVFASEGLLALSVLALAPAVLTQRAAFAYTALGLVLAGVLVLLAAIATITVLLSHSADQVVYEARKMSRLD